MAILLKKAENNDNSNQNESTVKDMSSSLKNIRENNYDKLTGKYIGVPLNGSAFFKDRTSTYHTTVVMNDIQIADRHESWTSTRIRLKNKIRFY